MRSITEAEQLLNNAIQQRDADLILMTFLQLIVAVEDVISINANRIYTTLSPAEVEMHGDSFKRFIEGHILAYVAAPASDEQGAILRVWLQAKPQQAPACIAWFRSQWQYPTYPTELALESIANALRGIITVINGHIELFRRFLALNSERETAYCAISDSTTALRASRTRVQRYLAERGIDIQTF